MMVPRLLASAPVVGNKPTADTESPDGQQFAQLLDEKEKGAAVKPQLPGSGLPVVHFPSAADGATPSADEADATAAEDETGESLLALLNRCQGNKPLGEATKKEKPSLAEDNDPQPGDLPGASAQPLVALKNPEAATVAEGGMTAEDTPELAADSLSIPLITDPGASRADKAVTSAFVLTHSSAVKPDTQLHAEQAIMQPALSADASITQPVATGLTVDLLQADNKLPPVKESGLSHSGERQAFQPELTLSAMAASEPASTAGTGSALAPDTGLLTGQMGTPAWQQSLGEQVACFTRNGIQHAELRLHPEELGSLQITLQLKNEQAQLHFVSASHQVRAAIEASVPHLRTSLAESGIELGQSSVGADMPQSWNGSGHSEPSPRQTFSHAQSSDNSVPSEERVEIAVRTRSLTGGINTFA